MDTFTVQSRQRSEFVDITQQLRDSLSRSAMLEGFGVVYVMHTTAGLTINDRLDPAVTQDIILGLDRLVPRGQEGFQHKDGDSDAHIKASLMGPSLTLVVEHGQLALGRYQGVFLCEFDGPRKRSVKVTWMAIQGEDRKNMF
jgi:secondary thiamine-phosphate synthase enzyme